MIRVKDTEFYKEVIKELNYAFGDVYVFKGIVISEIKGGINFTWDEHAKQIVEDISCYLGTDGTNIIYISNRINSYSVTPQDWLKFFKFNYGLKGYYVVTNTNQGNLNTTFERLFFKNKIKKFTSLYEAINSAKSNSEEVV
ncbi:hypothetical protein [Seonamhaeicola marinus]|uniref:STAS/SEC14 domain-containing protein n=1 Tax=Seonamhaeicola marinus TaxID=1912246 RepID=A0A5D0HN33_9FLAO|nr:hypothetical protein [Seonamhaeicola marinus]TYA71447.1 hypothetical protein FUA24_17855 [Seonamhaeicola marinus]